MQNTAQPASTPARQRPRAIRLAPRVEHLAASHFWPFERACEDEIVIVVRGKWADYQVAFTWMHDMEALHLACAFELKAPERSNTEIEHLIPMINAQMWVGHFEFWPTDRLVVFRHTLVLSRLRVDSARCSCLLPSTQASSTTRRSSL